MAVLVPESCGKCDKGEVLTQYQFNQQTQQCTRICQTHDGEGQAYSAAISGAAVAITGGLIQWGLGYIRRNQGGNRRWDEPHRYAKISAEKYLEDYQKVQWESVDEDHPYIFSHFNHTVAISADEKTLRQYGQIRQNSLGQKTSGNTRPISWNDLHELTAKPVESRADTRMVTAIEYEWTRYNYNGHDSHGDETFSDDDMTDIFGSMVAAYEKSAHKVLCFCGVDTAYGGQAFKITMAGSFGNGKFQKFDCGSCASGAITPGG